MNEQTPKRVVIIWASFAWLSVVLKLRRRLWKNVDIKLFDGRDQFCYIPWLHEWINNPQYIPSLLFPISQYYPEFINETVTTVTDNTITTASWITHNFDYCVIATWSRTNFYNNKEREEHWYTMRYLEDLLVVNEKLKEPETKHITVIWWWYTGVEVASTIAQTKRPDQSVRIIHSGPRLFHRLWPSISKQAIKRLEKHNVEVVINKKVHTINPTTLSTEDGAVYPSNLTIVSAWISINDELIDPKRTFQKQYHSEENDRIFLCGDVAVHGLLTTAHNAMMEWRRVWDLIADRIKWIRWEYSPIFDRDKLAIALGTRDGIVTDWKHGIYFPRLTWFAKKVIQHRVLIEFKYKIMFWI